IHSPVRMCQPISASPRRESHPWEPATNSHMNRAMKKQSENEGMRALVQIVGTPAFATGAPLTFAAATDDCNVATLDHRPRGYQALVGRNREDKKSRSQEFKKTTSFRLPTS